MKHLNESIYENINNQSENIDESMIGGILAFSVLAWVCTPLFTMGKNAINNFSKNVKDFSEKIKNKFKPKDKENFDKKSKDKNNDDKDDKNKSSDDILKSIYQFNKLLCVADKLNNIEKDEDKKNQNSSLLKLLSAGLYNEDKTPASPDNIWGNMKKLLPPHTDLSKIEKSISSEFKKIKNDDIFQTQLNGALEKVTDSEMDEFIDKIKKTGEETKKECQKLNKENEEILKKIKKLEEKVDLLDGPEKEAVENKIKDLKSKLNSSQNTIVQDIASVGGEINTQNTETQKPKPDNNKENADKTDDGEELDVDDSDLTDDNKINQDEQKEIDDIKNTDPEPKKPKREVKKRKKKLGKGTTYFFKDDPEKKSIGKDEAQQVIKAQVLYNKKLAKWKSMQSKQDTNESFNQSLTEHLKKYLF